MCKDDIGENVDTGAEDTYDEPDSEETTKEVPVTGKAHSRPIDWPGLIPPMIAVGVVVIAAATWCGGLWHDSRQTHEEMLRDEAERFQHLDWIEVNVPPDMPEGTKCMAVLRSTHPHFADEVVAMHCWVVPVAVPMAPGTGPL